MSVLCYKLFHVFFSSRPGEMEWTRFLSAWCYYLAGKDNDDDAATEEVSNIIYVVYDGNFVIFVSFLCLCLCVPRGH